FRYLRQDSCSPPGTDSMLRPNSSTPTPPRAFFTSQATYRRLLVVIVGLAIVYTFRASFVHPDSGDMDFGAYHRAAQAARAGVSPYEIDEEIGPLGAYSYAPAYAFLMTPLAHLEYVWAFRIWLALDWAATIACFWLAANLILPEEERARRWPLFWLAAIPVGGYFWANVRVGQAGALVLLACLGWALCRQRGRPMLGGAILA